MSPNDKGKMRANLWSKDGDLEFQDGPVNSQRPQIAMLNDSPATYFPIRRSPVLTMLANMLEWPFIKKKGSIELERSGIEERTSQDFPAHPTNHQENASQQASSSSLIPSPNVSRDRPSGGFFEGPADKVEIKGGIINHTLGDYTNVTIHMNQHDTPSHYLAPVSELVSHLLSTKPHEGDNTPQQHSPLLLPSKTLNHSAAAPSAQGPSVSITIYSPDNGNKIYEEHLERKKRGFPLWIPGPSRTLPMPYRRRGVDIGDVGIITPSGGFSFLFNICLPPDHPINPRTLPEGFTPIYPPIERMDICEYSAFNPESHLASAIEKIDDPQFPGLSFVTSDTQGAVLTLPDGVIARDFENISRFRAYAAANIENWYRYVNGPRGREAKNGDIRLVYGCDKATSWGIAAVANMTQHKTHYLKYRSVVNGGATPALIPLYKWEYTGLVEARVGPELREIEDLKQNDDSDVAVEGKYWNQSPFIRTLNLRLNEDVFAKINREVECALREESQQYHSKGGSGSSTTNPPNTSAHIGQQFGTTLVNQTGFNSESLGSAPQPDNVVQERVTIWRSPSAPESHPADALNKLLLQKVPNSRVVITEDENWCSVIEEDDDIMPSPSEIAERALATHHIMNEHDVVFLESKVAPLLHEKYKCKGCRTQFLRMDALNEHLKSKVGAKCTRAVESAHGVEAVLAMTAQGGVSGSDMGDEMEMVGGEEGGILLQKVPSVLENLLRHPGESFERITDSTVADRNDDKKYGRLNGIKQYKLDRQDAQPGSSYQQPATNSATQTESIYEFLGPPTERIADDNVLTERMTTSRSPIALISYAAGILNKLRLQKAPINRVVITQDEDRYSASNKDDGFMSNPFKIAKRSHAVNHIKEEDGAVIGPRVVGKIKKKALLIGIQNVREEPTEDASPGLLTSRDERSKWSKRRKQSNQNYLKDPHDNVRAMRELLINVYHYEPEDITVLIDDGIPRHVQPTRNNILKAVDDLIEDAKEHDRFFFHYSSYSTQEDNGDIEEEDRNNEFIITSDGERIKDDELRANLAMPLPAGSSLIAVFDSCHSGTLLDLKHFRCNRVYLPWLNKGNRRTNSLWNGNKRMQAQISARGGPIARPNKQVFTWARTSIDGALAASRDSGAVGPGFPPSKHNPSLSIITGTPSSPAPWLDSPSAREQQLMSPIATYCTGFCRESDLFTYENAVRADVISISSSTDSQLPWAWEWEDANGTHSMTQVLVKLLTKDPHPTYQNLLTLVSHEMHASYVELHSRVKTYKKRVQAVNKAKMLMGKKARPGDPVEINNFQNPQLSSDRPLDMSRHFYP